MHVLKNKCFFIVCVLPEYTYNPYLNYNTYKIIMKIKLKGSTLFYVPLCKQLFMLIFEQHTNK